MSDASDAHQPAPQRNPHMSTENLAHFRKLLLKTRRQVAEDVRGMADAARRAYEDGDLSHVPQHLADAGSDEEERERTLDLIAADSNLLDEIDAALERIEDGTYGVCEATGKPIPQRRLEVIPWAHHTVEAARQREGN